MEKIAFAFPGQGAQFIKMGQSFYENYQISKQTYDEASEVLGFDVAKLCFEGRVSELNEFSKMQLAIVVTEVAVYRAYVQELGVIPQFMLGHSIGEYAALVCTGAVSFSDVLAILLKRGELVQRVIDSGIGRMTIVENVQEEMLNNIIKDLGNADKVFISCFNSTSQLAISGYNEELDFIEEKLVQVGASISPLFSSPPMHSPLLNTVKEEFESFLQEFEFHPFNYPIISNVSGKPYSDPSGLAKILSEQLVNPVKWRQGIEKIYEYGVTTVIEMSPKKLLGILIKEIQPDIKNFCFSVKKDKMHLSEMIQADKNYEKDIPSVIGRCLGIIVSTENKNEDLEAFSQVTETYENITNLYDKWKENEKVINVQDEIRAIQMLINALKVKKLDEVEIKNWITSLLDETGKCYELQEVYSYI